jgi:hypothetical protein
VELRRGAHAAIPQITVNGWNRLAIAGRAARLQSGPGRLRSVNIHASPEFVTDWL